MLHKISSTFLLLISVACMTPLTAIQNDQNNNSSENGTQGSFESLDYTPQSNNYNGVWGSPLPQTPDEAFPEDAENNSLYEQIQNE